MGSIFTRIIFRALSKKIKEWSLTYPARHDVASSKVTALYEFIIYGML